MSFIRELLHDNNVAAISPSSSFVARRVIDAVLETPAQRIIELGPGDGAVTMPLLAALDATARYTAIESNVAFAAELSSRHDPRLKVIAGDAVAFIENAARTEASGVDAAIASIPFTYLAPHQRHAVIAAAHRCLKPGGRLVVFHQYTPLMFPVIKKTFGACRIAFEPLNIFPCFVLTATK